ncbi:SDR family oxidoreductase [Microterricola pindariensis]|uniref:Ketoreductase domain-containing protein n=1 Tax=Microterricola pindariensis TaxID=478010 RepID=A0ABX5B0B6_9MICO|nr:SDR family oxidoreductase [Microterricola pindariensis]PPL20234.1 hypothetical protein GY24_01425 [Microterricola pindariensis]
MSSPDAGAVVITGASSGIGKACAIAFAARGYHTLLLSRRLDDMVELDLANSKCVAVDVTDANLVRQTIQRYEANHGPIALLINNAGIMPLGKVHSQDPAEWAAVFETNALSVLHASSAVLPAMLSRGAGTIVSVSSIAGRNVYANHTAYSGSKFAVHAMMESMRREYATSGVRFSVVAPGIVDTNLLSSVSDASIVASYQQTKDRLHGGLTAENIASAIVMIHEQPDSVCIRELVIAPTPQES